MTTHLLFCSEGRYRFFGIQILFSIDLIHVAKCHRDKAVTPLASRGMNLIECVKRYRGARFLANGFQLRGARTLSQQLAAALLSPLTC
jgi:hypothetical protein